METHMDLSNEVEVFLLNLESVILDKKELIDLNIKSDNQELIDSQLALRDNLYRLNEQFNNDSNLLTQFKEQTIAKFEDRLLLADIEKMIKFLEFYGEFNWSKEEIKTIESNLKFSKGELDSYEELFYKNFKDILEFNEEDSFKQAINEIFYNLNKWQYLEIIEHIRTFAKMAKDDPGVLNEIKKEIENCHDKKEKEVCVLKTILFEINNYSSYDIFSIKDEKMSYKPSIKETEYGMENKKLHQDILLFNYINGEIKFITLKLQEAEMLLKKVRNFMFTPKPLLVMLRKLKNILI